MEFTTRSTPAALPVRRSSSNHPKSGRPRNSSHTPARHHSRGNEERCIRISNLHRKTVAPTIFDVFAKFGTVEKVEINMDDNDQPDGTAFVLFAKAILNPSLVPSQLSIDGRPVKLEFVSEKALQNITWRNTPPGKRSQILVRQFSMGSLLEPKIFIEEWSATDDAAIVINYDMRQIQIFFNHLDTRYRLEFKFKDLLGDPKLERDDGATYFTVCLRNASRAWRQKKSLTVSKYSVSNNSQWERVIDIPLKAKEGGATSQSPDPASKRKPIMPIAREDTVNLGSWLVYRILFSTSPRYQDTLERLLDEAAEYNLVPRDARLQQKTFKVILASSLPRPKTHIERAKLLPFEVLWNLESLILANYFNEYNLDDDFYDMIVKLDPAVSCGILDLIATQKKRVWHPTLAFHEIWEKMGMKVLHQKRIPGYCAMMRKFVVTPSSIQILPPTLETTNRVIRHFRDHSERFARVQFVDEGGSRVSASHGGLNNEVIYNRIYKVLQNGIQIGSRRYDFLAMSSSQLREHGCWFFAPSRDLTPPMIRQWMGVFSHVKIVAKHAVRMGQCFSSTRPITRLEPEEVEFIDDVVHNGYTFSDGVGKISPAVAREVAIKMELKTVPSAFQFRLGGAKGVLTVSNYLNGRKVQLRPSQRKFNSNHTWLEVIRFSTLIPAYLNRQAITLLSTLGVKDEVFINKMDNMIGSLNKMLENRAEAIQVLNANLDEFDTARSMVKMMEAGFLEKKDPHLINLVNMFRVNLLKDLKKKAKIHVPKGAFLLGVMDETGSLQEGEVFCQVSEIAGGRRKVITGECVLFRNPCFHPGDIRVVRAVDSHKLRDLCDVIVFSAQGYRDIPSMCSGGDLDGDDYTVFWDPDLMPTIKNYEPMDYQAEEPLEVDEVKISHIQKFFVNYINNDNLGQIANAHLATADRSSRGALDGACLRLAQLHSLAVDFPKTGKPARLDDDLRVRAFPDFMQKKDKQMYESKKVLGRIYRSIDKADYKDYKSKLTNESDYDVRLRAPGMERYIADARHWRYCYNRDLLALMNQYGVSTEAEIVSGYIIKWSKKGNRKSLHELQKTTMTAVTSMRNSYRHEFQREFSLKNGSVGAELQADVDAKAAAWYYVTYHPNERRRDYSFEGGFFSFPWVVYDYLCDLARKNGHRVPAEDQAQPVDDAVIEAMQKKYARDKSPIQLSVHVSDSEDNEEEEDDDDETNASAEESDEEEEEVVEIVPSTMISLNSSVRKATTNNTETGSIKSPSLSDTQKPAFIPHAPTHINNDKQAHLDVDATEADLEKALLN